MTGYRLAQTLSIWNCSCKSRKTTNYPEVEMMSGLLRKFAVGAMVLGMPFTGANAATTCGEAVAQLQQYVAGVNQFANGEYYQGIPIRCGGNQVCMQMWLQQLNGWYMNQSNMVNGWYGQITANCSTANSSVSPRKVSRKKVARDEAPELDEDEVASIDVDDEDKTVRIRIPDNPMGYRK